LIDEFIQIERHPLLLIIISSFI